MLPLRLIGFSILYKKERRGACSVYLVQGIAKRHIRNKQSTPTPNRISVSPCWGVDMQQA